MDKPLKCPYCGKDYLTETVTYSEDKYHDIAIQVERCRFCNWPIYFIIDPIHQKLFAQFPRSSTIDIKPEISALSPGFEKCFTQAIKARDYGLDEIVGAGLRKALEHLITDYLVKIQNEINVDKLKLWEKISKLDKSLYATASANIARLIGNDFTHIENLNNADVQELIDNIILTTDLISTRLKAIDAETKLQKLKNKT